ncbi:hypothetical protein BHM03_00030242, partial [Ensete ventricosum]
VGGADLTCVRSAVRQLGSSVQPIAQLRQVGHVDGPDVRRCNRTEWGCGIMIEWAPEKQPIVIQELENPASSRQPSAAREYGAHPVIYE